MANIGLEKIPYYDFNGDLNLFPVIINILIDNSVVASISVDKLILKLDSSVNYFELGAINNTFYKYEEGDTFDLNSVADAYQMYSYVLSYIGSY